MSELNPGVRIAGATPAPPSPSPVSLRLRRQDGGALIAEEAVSHGDLGDALAELWFEACLRKGFADLALSEVRAQLRPVYPDRSEDGGAGRRCLGFELTARNPSGQLTTRFFPLRSLGWVAARAARELVSRGALEARDLYTYELVFAAAPAPDDAPAAGRVGSALAIAPPAGASAPATLSLPLAPLLERARGVDEPLGRDHFRAFYTARAREKAERVAREGGASNPPVETGGLLVGPLCICPESGELFAVIVDVLEAAHSEGTTYSLTYSGATWAQIQAVMRAKQADPATRGQRILGQVHGHSFLPLGGLEPCEACHLAAVCTRTSAYLSQEDLDWCRAVFHGQPWQLSHIFGFNARSEGVEAFYGQKGGALAARGYAVLDAPFDVPLPRGVDS